MSSNPKERINEGEMTDDKHPYDDDEETGQSATSSPSSADNQDKSGCCGSCLTVFRQEFSVRNFGFDFYRREAFETSQWRWPPSFFVIYRLALAIYSVSILIWTGTESWKDKYPWPTWLTNLSYLFLTLHLVYSAIIALTSACRRSRTEKISSQPQHPYGTLADDETLFAETTPDPELPLHLKLDWFLFVVASGLAPFVTVAYWVFLAPEKGIPFQQNDSINQHLVNSVIVVLELVISAIPVRLLHFVYISAFGLCYDVFTAIYWAVDHNNVLYTSFTNWNHPTDSIIRGVMVIFVAIPIIQLVLFIVYQLRLVLYRCLYHESYTTSMHQ